MKSSATSDNCLILTLDHFYSHKFWVEFSGSCLKTDVVSVFPVHKMTSFYIFIFF